MSSLQYPWCDIILINPPRQNMTSVQNKFGKCWDVWENLNLISLHLNTFFYLSETYY